MSETVFNGIILPPGVRRESVKIQITDGSCPECGAKKERFAPHFGGTETCMDCGHDREQGANG